MKNLLFLFFLFLVSSLSFSQTSMPVNYQAVIRDNQGLILANENVDIRFTIIQGSPTGSSIYLEDHKVKTNQFGLVNIELGTGLVLGGDFYTIDWSLNNYYLKLELQKNNGAGFIDLGTSKFNAVPFANYALNAGNVNNSDTSASNELQIITLSNNNLELNKGGGLVDLSPFLDNTDNQTLTRTGNQITISGGNSINLPTDNVFDGDSSVFNELQAISFVNDTLTLTNGGKVYLGAYNNSQAILFNAQQITNLTALKKADSTLFVNLIQVNSNSIQNLNNQYLFLAQKAVSDSLYLQNQINTHVAQDLDLDSLNELQIMSISNDTIYLSKSGFIVLPTDEVNDGDFDNTNELQILSISNDTLSLSNGGFVVLPDNVDDADNNPTNEIQVLSISNDTLYLSSGGFAVLPDDKFEDNDADSLNEIQMLSISNDSIFLSNGGFIVLPTDLVNDIDADTTNEVQTLSIQNNQISISKGNTISLPQDQVFDGDSSTTNELQIITLSNDTLTLSNGGYVVLPPDDDSDSTNEIQSLSISNDTVYLDNGGFVKLPQGFDGDYNSLTNKPDSLSELVNDLDLVTPNSVIQFEVGDTALGGVIFYISPNKKSGLVASLEDLTFTDTTNSTITVNFTWWDAQNFLSDPYYLDDEAKEYTDWRLPTQQEAFILYKNRAVLGQTTNKQYWTSTEHYQNMNFTLQSNRSSRVDFNTGLSSLEQKNQKNNVKPVRSFGEKEIIIPENLDNDPQNEIQVLSISNDTIFLSNGGSVKLPVDEVNDGDFDSYNEIQFISISGDSLKLSNGGYVDLSNYDNSAIIQGIIQKISNDSLQFQSLINSNTNNLSNLTTKRVIDSTLLTQRIDTVSQNISSHILNDLDKDTLNEIQVISISNDTLYLENGGFVDMADFRDYNKLENKPDSLSDFVNDMGFLTNQNTSTYQIGDTAFGGIIFYLSPSGSSGLVGALIDQTNSKIGWYNAMDQVKNPNNFDSRGKQFTDWRLPSKSELILLAQQKSLFGNFQSDLYWSSTESYNSSFGIPKALQAEFVGFGTFSAGTYEKSRGMYIRAIRSFGNETIIIPENLDNDSTNEIQNLSISGDTISISKGNKITIPKQFEEVGPDLKYSSGSISIGNQSPDSAASFDLSNSGKGFFLPTLTFAERENLVSPPDGLMIFQTDSISGIYIRQNLKWQRLNTSVGSSNKTLIYTNDGF